MWKFGRTGLSAIFRGKFIYQLPPNPLGPDDRWLSGGGTLTDAIYAWTEKFPESKQALLVMESGIANTLDMQSVSPEWAMSWMTRAANELHGGARYTPWESLEDT